MFVFNFGVESLEQSVKLSRVVLSISLAIPFSKHHFSKPTTKKQCFYIAFVVRAVFQLLYRCFGGERNPT